MARFHMNPKISVSVVFVAAMFMSIMDRKCTIRTYQADQGL
jgi:hypothetical protein